MLAAFISMTVASAPWVGLALDGGGPSCVAIAAVVPESPAWRAGLRRGDCIRAVDGERVKAPSRVQALLGMGSRHVVRLRDGRRFELEAMERPENAEALICKALEGWIAIDVENALAAAGATRDVRFKRPIKVSEVLRAVGVVARRPEVVVHVMFDRGCESSDADAAVLDAPDELLVERSARVRVLPRLASSPVFAGPDGVPRRIGATTP